jgi:hypothetical protein
MSEVKTNEPVKQEGEFKIKKKTPKKLTTPSDEPVKVNIKEPLVELPPEVTKVVIPKEDAIQVGETKEVSVEEPSGDSSEVGEPVQESNETPEGFSAIKEVTEEEVKEVEAQVEKAVQDEKILGKALPENIEKLVSFMEETGGTIEDYTRLNADYSKVDDVTLLKEYYKKEKPYLEGEDIDMLLEDFIIDEDIDEDRDARKKRIAFKEEVAKAKNYLEETKSKYYDEIKLRPEDIISSKKQLSNNMHNLRKVLKSFSTTISKVSILKSAKKVISTIFRIVIKLQRANRILTTLSGSS